MGLSKALRVAIRTNPAEQHGAWRGREILLLMQRRGYLLSSKIRLTSRLISGPIWTMPLREE
jgi:hypothetical protein